MLSNSRTCVFWDLDETLVHTYLYNQKFQSDCDFVFDYLGQSKTKVACHVRKSAMEALKLSRDRFGPENVFILTGAPRDYAETINARAMFGFTSEQIISKEIIYARGMHHVNIDPLRLTNKNNILIDDLNIRHNLNKVDLVGVKPKRYLQVRPYYGYDLYDDNLLNVTQKFLNKQN